VLETPNPSSCNASGRRKLEDECGGAGKRRQGQLLRHDEVHAIRPPGLFSFFPFPSIWFPRKPWKRKEKTRREKKINGIFGRMDVAPSFFFFFWFFC